MIIEENNWEPLQPEEVSELFKSLDINWWIAEGWAIDIFLGKKSREHLDIDVLILRKDQIIIHKHLNEWELYKTNQPRLKPWEKGEYLEIGVNSVWCKETSDSPWVLEIMFLDTIKDEWFFRHNPKIRLTLMEIGLHTNQEFLF
ncbi:MAG: aminoglycoside adenylyltransferase [Candidatus Heimdallarchaeota archaeon]